MHFYFPYGKKCLTDQEQTDFIQILTHLQTIMRIRKTKTTENHFIIPIFKTVFVGRVCIPNRKECTNRSGYPDTGKPKSGEKHSKGYKKIVFFYFKK